MSTQNTNSQTSVENRVSSLETSVAVLVQELHDLSRKCATTIIKDTLKFSLLTTKLSL